MDAERDALSSGPRCLAPLERDAMDTVGGEIVDGRPLMRMVQTVRGVLEIRNLLTRIYIVDGRPLMRMVQAVRMVAHKRAHTRKRVSACEGRSVGAHKGPTQGSE